MEEPGVDFSPDSTRGQLQKSGLVVHCDTHDVVGRLVPLCNHTRGLDTDLDCRMDRLCDLKAEGEVRPDSHVELVIRLMYLVLMLGHEEHHSHVAVGGQPQVS